jgi:hypothetical protein
MLERVTSAKHSNVLGQFIGYEENEVLWIRTLVTKILLVNWIELAREEEEMSLI